MLRVKNISLPLHTFDVRRTELLYRYGKGYSPPAP